MVYQLNKRVGRILFLLPALLLVLPIGMAIDTLTAENCRNLPISCSYLDKQTKNMSREDEKQLVLQLLESKMSPPYHEFVESWNRKLNFDAAPENASIREAETIEGAWLKIATAFPSVAKSGIFVPGKGTIMTVYGYKLNLPQNYGENNNVACGDEPSNDEKYGDCKTTYANIKDNTNLQISKNGQMIGSQKFTNFNSSKVNEFEAVLTITNEISLKHYKWQKGKCCKERCRSTQGGSKCECIAYEYKCAFDKDDKRQDSLELRDHYSALMEESFQDFEPKLVLSISARPLTAMMKIPIKNVQSYTIKTKYQTLKKDFSVYSFNYTLSPQNVLFVQAKDKKGWFTENAKIISVRDYEDGTEAVAFVTSEENVKDCDVTIQTFFNTTKKKCVIERLAKTDLKIETNKWFYGLNDTIQAKITLGSEKERLANYVNVEYGGQKQRYLVEGEKIISLKPEIGASIIIASMDSTDTASSFSASALINVSEKRELTIAFDVFMSMLVLYFGISALVKFYKKAFST